MATYSSGSQLKWREVESGQLPSPRQFLQATSVDNVLFITGGEECVDGACNDITSILSWDSVAETWQGAGNLSVARHSHAAVAVPSSIIVCSGCSAMLLSATGIICSLLFHFLFVNNIFRL